MSNGAIQFREMALAAFEDQEPPKQVTSPLAREVQEGWQEMEKALAGVRWQEVPPNVLERHAANMIALTISAFVYYLPAFMCAALREVEGDAATYTMYSLCPLGNYESFFDNTCTLFTPEQAKVIQAFLELLYADDSFVLFDEEMTPAIALWHRRAKPA